jgi:hypothetical protein
MLKQKSLEEGTPFGGENLSRLHMQHIEKNRKIEKYTKNYFSKCFHHDIMPATLKAEFQSLLIDNYRLD